MTDKENVTEKSVVCCQGVLTWSIAFISSPAASVRSPCAPVSRWGGGRVWRARFRCRGRGGGGGGAWTRWLCIICRRRSQICTDNQCGRCSHWLMEDMNGKEMWRVLGFIINLFRIKKKSNNLTIVTDNKVIMFHAAVLFLSSRRQCRGTLDGTLASTSRGIAWEDVS